MAILNFNCILLFGQNYGIYNDEWCDGNVFTKRLNYCSLLITI